MVCFRLGVVVGAGGGTTVVVWPEVAVGLVVVVVGRGLVVVVREGRGVGVVAGGVVVLPVPGGRPWVCGLAPLLVNAKAPSPTATTATPTRTKPARRIGRIPCMLTAG